MLGNWTVFLPFFRLAAYLDRFGYQDHDALRKKSFFLMKRARKAKDEGLTDLISSY